MVRLGSYLAVGVLDLLMLNLYIFPKVIPADRPAPISPPVAAPSPPLPRESFAHTKAVSPPAREPVAQTGGPPGYTLAVHFRLGQTRVRSGDALTLAAVAQQLAEQPGWQVVVSGHTDLQGEARFNKKLSRQRAQTVARTLAQHGVAAERIHTQSFGESQPLTKHRTPSAHRRNRRVEIQFIMGSS